MHSRLRTPLTLTPSTGLYLGRLLVLLIPARLTVCAAEKLVLLVSILPPLAPSFRTLRRVRVSVLAPASRPSFYIISLAHLRTSIFSHSNDSASPSMFNSKLTERHDFVTYTCSLLSAKIMYIVIANICISSYLPRSLRRGERFIKQERRGA